MLPGAVKVHNHQYNSDKPFEKRIITIIIVIMDIYSNSNEEILQALGERLRAGRLAANLTQQMLARQSGVSLNTVRNAEDGQNVSVDTLVNLLRALNMLPLLEYLLENDGPSPVDLARRDGLRRQRATGRRPGRDGDWSW